MDLARRSPAAGELQSQDSTHGVGIARRAGQPHAQAWPGAGVAEELRGGAVLCDDQVRAPVVVEVRDRGAALFTVNPDAAGLARHRNESALAVTEQQQSPAGVETGILHTKGEK